MHIFFSLKRYFQTHPYQMKYLIYLLIVFVSFSCQRSTKSAEADADVKALTQREQKAMEKVYDLGEPMRSITFEVKADQKDFEDGIQPWVNMANPSDDLLHLIAKDEVVIAQPELSVIIDYPLNNEYKFDLQSENGFSREKLALEISKAYHRIYEEEERSATIKTLPMEQRKIHNRNETNGKYGIWGHDIGDLVLSGILVHQTADGKLVLTLNIES